MDWIKKLNKELQERHERLSTPEEKEAAEKRKRAYPGSLQKGVKKTREHSQKIKTGIYLAIKNGAKVDQAKGKSKTKKECQHCQIPIAHNVLPSHEANCFMNPNNKVFHFINSILTENHNLRTKVIRNMVLNSLIENLPSNCKINRIIRKLRQDFPIPEGGHECPKCKEIGFYSDSQWSRFHFDNCKSISSH